MTCPSTALRYGERTTLHQTSVETAAGSVMEEREQGESEPVDLRCGEQAELISLGTNGAEEATREEAGLGGKEKLMFSFVALLAACGSACLSEPRPLSGSQLIRVRDNTTEQHGPSVCGSYKQKAQQHADRRAVMCSCHLVDSSGPNHSKGTFILNIQTQIPFL